MNLTFMDYEENREIALGKLNNYYHQNGSSCELNRFEAPFQSLCGKISFVVEDGGFIIGRILGYYDDITNSVKIEILFVEETARGKKVGHFLMKSVEDLARSEGVQACFVDTSSTSAPMFYEKLGYKLIATLPEYPMQGEEYFMYWKRL